MWTKEGTNPLTCADVDEDVEGFGGPLFLQLAVRGHLVLRKLAHRDPRPHCTNKRQGRRQPVRAPGDATHEIPRRRTKSVRTKKVLCLQSDILEMDMTEKLTSQRRCTTCNFAVQGALVGARAR